MLDPLMRQGVDAVNTLVKDGTVYLDTMVVDYMNQALALVLMYPPPEAKITDEFVDGAVWAMKMYKSVKDEVTDKHAAELVPDSPEDLNDLQQ